MSSTMKSVADGLVFSSVSSAVVRFFSMVSYFLIIRAMSLHDYGIFVLLTASIAPSSTFIFFGFDQVFISSYSAARGKNQYGYMKGLFSGYYSTVAVLAVIFLALAFILKNVIALKYNFYLAQFFWEAIFLAYGQIFLNAISMFLTCNERFKEVSVMESFESFARAIFVILFLFFSSIGIVQIMICYALAKYIAAFVGLFFGKQHLAELFKNKDQKEKDVLISIIRHHGKWEIIRNMFEQFTQPLKLWFIKLFVNIQSVAAYDFARSVYSVITSLAPFRAIIFPVVSRLSGNMEKVRLVISKSVKYNLIFYVGIYILMLLVSPVVLKYIFPQYLGSLLIIYFICLHLFVDVYKLGQDAIMYAFRQQKKMAALSPPLLILQSISDIVLIKTFGVLGAAISWHLYAFISGYFFNVVIVNKIIQQKISLRQILTFDEYDRLILRKIVNKIPFLKNMKYFSGNSGNL